MESMHIQKEKKISHCRSYDERIPVKDLSTPIIYISILPKKNHMEKIELYRDLKCQTFNFGSKIVK